MNGSILAISGPSGTGKSTLLSQILAEQDNVYFSISTTTRAIRDGEREGVNYHFVDKSEFQQGIKKGEFIEWAEVHGNYYGTSMKPVADAFAQGKLIIFDIDVQGFRLVKSKFPHILTSVFITTDSQSELKNRLLKRGTDNEETINTRISNALTEMQSISEYDFLLINDDLDLTLERLRDITKVARYKISKDDSMNFYESWIN